MAKNYASGWNELTTKNSWMLFKIMGEFVQGFEKMGHHNPCISIFGSARTQKTHPNYILANEIAKRIVDLGFGVITGGGPGIMEAANKGAQEAGGASVGLTIDLPFEKKHNNTSHRSGHSWQCPIFCLIFSLSSFILLPKKAK